MAVPERKRLSVCLTFDFDAMSGWIANTDDPAAIARGEFAAVALPRIVSLLFERGLEATFFVPGHTALAYPELVRQLRDAGHEIGHHGWVHENVAELDLDAERSNFVRALDALQDVAGVRPVGYRAPSGHFSRNTIDVLLEHGIEYESSLGGSDYTPYYLRRGDRWSKTEPYEFGHPCRIVELPFSWVLDDWPHFEFQPGWSTQQATPSAVLEIWQGEFDFAYEHGEGGVFVLCLHPEVIGRGHRLVMLAGLIDYMLEKNGVEFAPGARLASRWRAEHPLT